MTWNQGPQGPMPQPPGYPNYGMVPPVQGKSNAKWWVIGCTSAFLLLVVLPVALLIGGFIFTVDKVNDSVTDYAEDYSAAVAVSDRFVSAVRDGRPDDAYAETGVDYRSQTTREEAFAEFERLKPEMSPNVYRTLDNRQVGIGETKELRLLYGTRPETNSYLTVVMRKDGEAWKVQDFEYSETRPDEFAATTTTAF